jgi:hypothetical protein
MWNFIYNKYLASLDYFCTPFAARVKNAWSYTSTSHMFWRLRRENLHLHFYCKNVLNIYIIVMELMNMNVLLISWLIQNVFYVAISATYVIEHCSYGAIAMSRKPKYVRI